MILLHLHHRDTDERVRSLWVNPSAIIQMQESLTGSCITLPDGDLYVIEKPSDIFLMLGASVEVRGLATAQPV